MCILNLNRIQADEGKCAASTAIPVLLYKHGAKKPAQATYKGTRKEEERQEERKKECLFEIDLLAASQLS